MNNEKNSSGRLASLQEKWMTVAGLNLSLTHTRTHGPPSSFCYKLTDHQQQQPLTGGEAGGDGISGHPQAFISMFYKYLVSWQSLDTEQQLAAGCHSAQQWTSTSRNPRRFNWSVWTRQVSIIVLPKFVFLSQISYFTSKLQPVNDAALTKDPVDSTASGPGLVEDVVNHF